MGNPGQIDNFQERTAPLNWFYRPWYTTGVKLYSALIFLASPFNKKAKQWIQGRKKFPEPYQPGKKGRVIWFHCASLGEFEQGLPVMEAIKAEEEEAEIIISFFSPSGYEIRKNHPIASRIIYLPADTLRNAKRLISTFQPDLAVFVKYEFWYNYLYALKEKDIPFLFISSRFRPRQVFFKPFGGWFRWHLAQAEHIFHQDEASFRLLEQSGTFRHSVSGDTRYDRVSKIVRSSRYFPEIQKFIGDRFCLVAGSTWPPDEKLIETVINSDDESVFIIAPHEISQARINSLMQRFPGQAIPYSRLREARPEHRILVIDNIGMLSALYAYAELSYVGGGFGSGLHNILEPAAHGKAVIFGPEHKQFPEAAALIEAGGGYSVKDSGEILNLWKELKTNKEKLVMAGKSSRSLISARSGATPKIMEKVRELLR